MPRNGSGTFSLPENPFVPNTVISSSAVNNDFSDIADALTESLARDGQGGMQAVLPLDATGFSYNNDTNTGMRRTSADSQAIKCGGIDIVDITTTGAEVTGDLSVTGTVTKNGNPLLPVGLGPLPWSGTAEPVGWVLCYGQSLSRTTYAALWAFAQAEIALGNTLYGPGDGTTSFTVADIRGRLPAGKDNMGGSAAGILTTTMTPNGNTLGATGGGQFSTLDQTNLPNVSFTVTIPSGQGSHLHSFQLFNTVGAAAVALQGSGSFVAAENTALATLPAMSGTAASGGVAATFTNVQPAIITNYIIYAGI